jgi:hypothetical protein
LDFVTLQLSKVNWRKGLVCLGAVAGIAIVASALLIWRHARTRDPLAGLKPGVYQPKQGASGDTLPVPAPAPRK